MKVTVKNPTSTGKAVRTLAGLPTIAPGKSITVDVDWSPGERARYQTAGLVITEGDVKPAHAPKAKSGA